MVILTFVSHYLPACKAGGPIRSIANLVECLGDEFDFRVVTSDRDYGDTGPFEGIPRDSWIEVGKGKVIYLSPEARTLSALAQLTRETPHNVVYLNSFFGPVFTIRPLLLRRLHRVPNVPTIVAPRGELSPGALALRSTRKHAYRGVARSAGLVSHVTWQATSEMEATHIRGVMGSASAVRVAPNLVTLSTSCDLPGTPKVSGTVRAVLISRLAPKKNLHYLGEVLPGLRGTVSLDLYGVTDYPAYWAKCQESFASLPSNVTVTYHGPVDHTQVSSVLAEADLFVLPTLGENFCHAAAEAFAAGCPVLISDQTPWRGLEGAKAGWDLPLDRPEAFTEAIQRVIDMDEDEHRQWREGARTYIETHPLVAEAIELNRQLFLSQLAH